jgi:8-oxo-dGTP pyrophosphatase MutT (NUDIX family)
MSPAAPAERVRLVDRAFRVALWIAYRMLLAGWFVFRPRRRGVFVAVWYDGRVLAIRNSYRRWLALPAGGMQRGETPLDAALRELREEVGIAAAPEALRFVRDIPTTFEWKRDVCAFFELVLDAPIEPRADRREVVWAGFVTPDEALRANLAPPVRDYLEARMGDRSSQPQRS